MRICLVNILLLAVLLLVVLFYYHMVRSSLPVENHIMKLPGIFPVVGIILTFLAYRNIHEDEILVQSYDHLR
jgi:ABC-type sulfate transport system permease component